VTTTRQTRALGRPPGVKGEDRRRRLVEVTVELLAESSYATMTVSEVAERAGVTSGAVYYYFPSKFDLVKAAYEANGTVLTDWFRQKVDGDAPLRAQLDRILEEAIVFNREFPHHSRLTALTAGEMIAHPELAEVVTNRAWRPYLVGLVATAVDRGELGSEASPAAFADMLSSTMRGLAIFGTHASPEDHAAAVRAFKQVLLNGI
jgi:AcrR family transcriptional regulator